MSPSRCVCEHERRYHLRDRTCMADDCKCFAFRDELTQWTQRAMAS